MDDIKSFVAEMMQHWETPGVAVAVVRDGKLVLAEGFGVRDREQQTPVTSDTVFAIASATKAFTTFALGLLVDAGKLNWDAPVREYLPEFRMHDPFASERITPRDLVCHRSGLPRHDMAWYNSAATRRELMQQVRYLQPSKDFRTTWQYQNLMYVVAGYLIGEIAGCSWEEYIRTHIFAPLGMDNSQFAVAESQQAADFAVPYCEKAGELTKIPFRPINAIAPAGSINSTIADMAQWLLLQVNGGILGKERFISESNLAQMHTPQMVMQPETKFDEVLPFGYGLGWFIDSYRGYKLVHHGGNIDGFSTLVSLMPQQRLGIVVMTNREASFLPRALSYGLYDRLLDLAPAPWNERFDAMVALTKNGAQQAAKQRTERTSSQSRPLSDFVGSYQHPGYGTLQIESHNDELSATLHDLRYQVVPDAHTVFDFIADHDQTTYKSNFATDLTGRITSVAIPFEPMVKPINFERIADPRMRERDFLAPFAGTYALPNMTLIVTLQGDHTLVLGYVGQPSSELLPLEGTTFEIKGQSGITVEFKSSAQATELLLTHPGGIWTATRQN